MGNNTNKAIELQNKLIEFIKGKICNEFEVCSKIFYDSIEKESIYSPAFLGLIGSVLHQTPINDLKPILNIITEKIHNTPNVDGMYNFLGDSNYFYDIDSTVIVNNYLLESGENEKFIKKIDTILDSLRTTNNGFYTWINKESNNLDWVVNLNVFVFLKKVKNKKYVGQHSFLLDQLPNYLEKGSKYYPDNNLPLFFLLLYFNNGILSDDEFKCFSSIHSKYSNSNQNILSLCCRLLLKQNSYLDLNEMNESIYTLWLVDVKYTASSTSYYVSDVLNAAIALYLLNKLNSFKNEQK
jgi:hypothetical protein